MKKTIFSFAIVIITMLSNAKASTTVVDEFSINDNHVEQMFAASNNVTLEVTQSLNLETVMATKSTSFSATAGGGKSQILAIVLDLFVGGLGIHRAYLGTKTFTWVGYILSCGGIFGIVPLVDLIVMAINGVDDYTDNSKFFMW